VCPELWQVPTLLISGFPVYDERMGIVLTLIIVGIVLLILGIAVKAAMFLLWIGIILLVVGAIMWIMRSVRSRT
jgi:membrane-bound ClpP family serine protease